VQKVRKVRKLKKLKKLKAAGTLSSTFAVRKSSKGKDVVGKDVVRRGIVKGMILSYSMCTLEFASDFVSEEVVSKLIKNYNISYRIS
jgi:hypothetical protein